MAMAAVALLVSSSADAFTQTQPQLSSAVRLPQHHSSRLNAVELDLSYNFDDDTSSSNSTPIRASNNGPLARLTHQQEVSLLRQMRDHPTHSSLYQMARQTLLLHNLPLVQSIVTKIIRSRPHLRDGMRKSGGGNNGNGVQAGAALSRDDLVHEGTIGLAEAIDKYDLAYASYEDGTADSTPKSTGMASSSNSLPTGARLGTYATYWIRARILRAIQSREHAIRFPEHVLLASHRLVRAAKEMEVEWGVVTELADYDVISVSQMKLRDELREAAGIKSDSQFRDAVRVRSMSRSGSTASLESYMSPSSAASSEEDLLSSEAGQEQILETLSKFLMPREVEVLSLRYGLISAEEKAADPRIFRDYEAEAEEELFGPNGVLSHYSSTPNDSVSARAATSNNNRQASAAAAPARMSSAPTGQSPTALLPFKEIGKRMKFSGEYCRRTCSIALEKLTQAVEDGRLAESDFGFAF